MKTERLASALTPSSKPCGKCVSQLYRMIAGRSNGAYRSGKRVPNSWIDPYTANNHAYRTSVCAKRIMRICSFHSAGRWSAGRPASCKLQAARSLSDGPLSSWHGDELDLVSSQRTMSVSIAQWAISSSTSKAILQTCTIVLARPNVR
jgi:hypothetical protein